MRVYYISSGLQGCYLVRCLLPLVANGWDGDQTSINPANRTPEDKAAAAKAADIVVFHRPDDPQKLKLAKLLQQQGKKIVFDNDDTYKDNGGFKLNEFMDRERMDKGLKRINESIDEFIKMADLVTCSTEFLAKEYRKLNDNVVVLPNCVDPFYFDEPLKNETDVVRIGVTGSIAVTSDMDVFKPILEHYQGREDVEFVLFSLPEATDDKYMRELYADEYAFLDNVNIEWQPFVPMHMYYETLNELRLDIGIIPRADTLFNRCKSNLKFLEYSMLEVPVIAQSFETGDSPYQQDSEDAKHVLLANTVEEWIDRIDYLIENPDERMLMGQEARKYVTDKYDIENNAHKWEEAYKKLWK